MTDDPSSGLAEFQALRPRLFGIAYRMLGSATDAEDILQDAWLRWQSVDRSTVRSPEAFLVRMVTNLCLTARDSARARREVYVGPWLPEPVLTADGALGPLDDAVQRRASRSPCSRCWNGCRRPSARRTCCARRSATAPATWPS